MFRSISRRDFLTRSAAATTAALVFPGLAPRPAAGIPMVVYKDPNCGCCIKWVELTRAAGFEISTRDTPDMKPIKQRYHVGPNIASCHTAVVGGYVVEGHVPADLIKRMLSEKPKVLGLAVPGMPVGSPGMEGTPKDAYDVMTFDAAGKTTVYARR